MIDQAVPRVRRRTALPLAAALWLAVWPVSAQILDDIEVTRDGDFALAQLRFTAPIRYLRHFPPARGETLNIYLQGLAADGLDGPPAGDRRISPRDPAVPRFTVTYTTGARCDSAPNAICLTVQFPRPTSYKVRLGPDKRSVLLFVALEARQ